MIMRKQQNGCWYRRALTLRGREFIVEAPSARFSTNGERDSVGCTNDTLCAQTGYRDELFQLIEVQGRNAGRPRPSRLGVYKFEP